MAGPKGLMVHESLAVCPEVALTGLWRKGHFSIMKLKRKDIDEQNLIRRVERCHILGTSPLSILPKSPSGDRLALSRTSAFVMAMASTVYLATSGTCRLSYILPFGRFCLYCHGS